MILVFPKRHGIRHHFFQQLWVSTIYHGCKGSASHHKKRKGRSTCAERPFLQVDWTFYPFAFSVTFNTMSLDNTMSFMVDAQATPYF